MIGSFTEKHREISDYSMYREKLFDLCRIIHQDYSLLDHEFCILERFIVSTEKCEVAYRAEDRRMIFWHMKDVDWLDDITVLKIVVEMLEECFIGAKEELFCGIDFFNFLNELSEKDGKISEVEYIWKAKKVINSIEVQFGKIASTDDSMKQIAILKGMLALI